MSIQKIRFILKEFRKIAKDPTKLYTEVWKDALVQDYIVYLNTENQLKQGKRQDGQPMREYASLSYLNAKRAAGLRSIPGEETDLFVSGRFYDTFEVKVLKDGFKVLANTDIYGWDFEETYGLVRGLSPENTALLREFIKEILPEILQREIFKGSLF